MIIWAVYWNVRYMLKSSKASPSSALPSFSLPCPCQIVHLSHGCVFMCIFFANRTPAPEGHPSDYELGSTRRGGAGVDAVYDPQVYDGKNIGRFINQGGLLEGIQALVASCDLEQGGDVYQPKVAENIFNQHANVVYTTHSSFPSWHTRKCGKQ